MSAFNLSNIIKGVYNGVGRNIRSNSTDDLRVTLSGDNVSPYGDIIIAEHEAVVQLDFVYNMIAAQLASTSVVSTGIADTDGGELRLQTGTGAAGSAILTSRRLANYRPGEGVTARFTTVFTTGAANSKQITGMGSSVDGYFFGFNGTSFGILHRNNSIDTWIPQSSWNNDVCDGTGKSGFNWDKTKGSVCQIRYGYLGYANATFYVMNPVDSTWILCHTIRYGNSSVVSITLNPSLAFYSEVTNSGNTSNLISRVGSVGVFIIGKRNPIGARFAVNNSKNAITTETAILSIRNATSFNGTANRAMLRIKSLSMCADSGNGITTIRVVNGATLGGTPVFTPINGTTADNGVTITSGQACASVDTAGTTVTGGNYIFNVLAARNSDAFVDLSDIDMFIGPGETLTFSAICQVSTNVAIAVNWSRDT